MLSLVCKPVRLNLFVLLNASQQRAFAKKAKNTLGCTSRNISSTVLRLYIQHCILFLISSSQWKRNINKQETIQQTPTRMFRGMEHISILQREAEGAGFVHAEENRFREYLITVFEYLERSCREDKARVSQRCTLEE